MSQCCRIHYHRQKKSDLNHEHLLGSQKSGPLHHHQELNLNFCLANSLYRQNHGFFQDCQAPVAVHDFRLMHQGRLLILLLFHYQNHHQLLPDQKPVPEYYHLHRLNVQN